MARNVRSSEERQQAAQALLNRHWVTKEDDIETYILIREHADQLREWFYDKAGLTLIVTRRFAKLEKIPGSYRPWMKIDGFYSARDYGLFTYGLWYLEGRGEAEQFLLSEMVDTIRDHLIGADVMLDWTLYDHRLSMARALRKLRELKVLSAVEGDEGDWARAGADANVLYEASPMARYVLRSFSKELMAYASIDELIEPWSTASGNADETDLAQAQTEQTRAIQARRHRIHRRLMLEPVVYDWEWREDELRYLHTQRSAVVNQLRDITGLEGSRFREAMLFTWPDLTGEMALFPTQAALSDLVLLLGGYFRRKLALEPFRFDRDEHRSLLLSRAEFEAILMDLKTVFGQNWTKDHRAKTTAQLASELLDHMLDWNLASFDSKTIRIHAALSRWNGSYADWDEEEWSV